MALLGSGDLCGSLGACPLCVKGCKTVTIKGVLQEKGIIYSLDY